jgi:hypothetical protein
MARWNLGQIMSYATAGIGHRSDIPKSVVSFLANEAMHQVLEVAPALAQEKLVISSTTSGENRVFLPDDFQEPISLSFISNVGSYRTLRLANHREFDAQGFTPVGVPDKYALFNEWVELHPSPNSAYSLQLRYRSYMTDMEDLTDTPSVSTSWRYAVVLKTKQLLADYVADPALAAVYENQYLTHISALDTDAAKRQNDKSGMGVRVIW